MGQSTNRKGFFPAYADAKITYLPEAASQTFATGDMLYLASGKVTIATAATTTLCGVAAAPSSGTTDNPTPCWATPGTVFVGRAEDANAAFVAGEVCDIKGATGAMLLDDDTATNVVVIVNAVDTTEDTTAAGVQYRFKLSVNQLDEA